MKHLKLFLILIFNSISILAQKPTIFFEAGGGNLGIVSVSKLDNNSYHGFIGIGISKKIENSNFGINISTQYLNKHIGKFKTSFYDAMYKEQILFDTDFDQNEFGLSANIYHKLNKKLCFETGATIKYLINSKLNMNPIGNYNATPTNINAKYYANNYQSTAMFNSYNYALNFGLNYLLIKHLTIGYRFSYDLEVNPIYYYFNSYNTYYNSIILKYTL